MDEIQIIFEFEYEHGMKYRDALYLPANHTFTDAEIEAMKQERFQNWISIITADNSPQE